MNKIQIFDKFQNIYSHFFVPNWDFFCNTTNIARSKQTHSDKIIYVNRPWKQKDWDCLITDKQNIFLEIRVADCFPILIYAENKQKKMIASIHSGRKWTQKNIIWKTLDLIKEKNFNTDQIFIWIGPWISQKNFEFWPDANKIFAPKYIQKTNWKNYIDIKWIILDQIKKHKILKKNIEIYNSCTFENTKLLSRRRDKTPLRMQAIIWIINEF